jgi:hypothetical protein
MRFVAKAIAPWKTDGRRKRSPRNAPGGTIEFRDEAGEYPPFRARHRQRERRRVSVRGADL